MSTVTGELVSREKDIRIKNSLSGREDHKLNTSQQNNLLQKRQILFCEQKNTGTGQYAVLRETGKASFRFLGSLRGKQSPYESRRIRKEILKERMEAEGWRSRKGKEKCVPREQHLNFSLG